MERRDFPRAFALCQVYEIYLVNLNAKMLHSLSSSSYIKLNSTSVKQEIDPKKEEEKEMQDKQKRKK